MLPQLLEVDLEVSLDLARAATSDELADTLDYGELIEICRRVVEEGDQRLLEAVAGAIADEVTGLAGVEGVTVRVRKPAVPLDVEMDFAQIELRRDGR
jgi:dihydroneopterin aldolase